MIRHNPKETTTRNELITPKIIQAGWHQTPHSYIEEYSFTDGRILTIGNHPRRQVGLRVDYVLRYRRDFMIAIVEAKAADVPAMDGLQQAKTYAQTLNLDFAYATNGHEIIEFDFVTGRQSYRDQFPTPQELWGRLQQAREINDQQADILLTPYDLQDKTPRYYQEIAINRTVEKIVKGETRLLLTMATGTGKTFVAFQICQKLWDSRWNQRGAYRRPKILYLADRNVLIDNPKDNVFSSFKEARHKVTGDETRKSRDIYFATYQTMINVYEEYSADFFDLVIVDECHRGSAREDSLWREVLNYFSPACQLGLTATPLRDESRDTYQYFGNPIYTYSLKQGIEDGFLAPYRVHYVVTSYDAQGWRPEPGDIDRYGRAIPDEEYQTKDFERAVALRARTEAIAKHLTNFLKQTNRLAKTIVFCVDIDHAGEMAMALNNLNADLVTQFNGNYTARITSAEGRFNLLNKFQDVESDHPVIVTTSQLLTTGVDIPTCTNIVIARVINSMAEFKQIIGRGTRLRTDYNKLIFNILDYTNASRLFNDPDFDGVPVKTTTTEIDDEGEIIIDTGLGIDPTEPHTEPDTDPPPPWEPGPITPPRKYYFDEGQCEIDQHIVRELDPDGNELRVVKYVDFTGEKVRILYPTAMILRQQWSDPEKRDDVIQELAKRGITLEELQAVTEQPQADPFDLLCFVAFNGPLRTRQERATKVRQEQKQFFEQFKPEAKAILNDLLDKYTDYGVAQFKLPDILNVPPISDRGTVREVTALFEGQTNLRQAVDDLQRLIYAV